MSFTESLDKIVEENRNQLVGRHASWVRVRLGDIASILNGFPFESYGFTADPNRGCPLIRIRDVLHSATNTYYVGEFDSAYLVQNGDLLVGMDGDFNSAVWRGDPGLLNQRVCKVALQSSSFDKRFLAYCLPGYLSAINAHTSSITVKHLSSRTITDIPLPLAPLLEQSRIADTLDELFSDLDAGVAALERARAKLKLYRASVLKAAVEGALTAGWRAQHPDTEPAAELLQRILAERRQRWEEAQLARYEAKGQAPPKNWKAKYKEPVGPDTEGLPGLPEGWCWATLSQIAWSAGYGTSEKCRETNTGLAVLRIPNIIGGRLNLEDLKFAPPEYSERDEDLISVGDLLVVRTNGSRSLIGRGAVVRDPQSTRLSFASYLIRLRLIPHTILLHWVSLLWDSFHVRRWIEARAATSAGQYNISLGVLEKLIIPVPPLAEQAAIVETVEDQLSVIDHLEAELDAKRKSAQALRQSILRHAFTGQLVPQDPSDEPASELLRRIAAERTARAATTAGSRPRRTIRRKKGG